MFVLLKVLKTCSTSLAKCKIVSEPNVLYPSFAVSITGSIKCFHTVLDIVIARHNASRYFNSILRYSEKLLYFYCCSEILII
jgi:hypothetical protein